MTECWVCYKIDEDILDEHLNAVSEHIDFDKVPKFIIVKDGVLVNTPFTESYGIEDDRELEELIQRLIIIRRRLIERKIDEEEVDIDGYRQHD